MSLPYSLATTDLEPATDAGRDAVNAAQPTLAKRVDSAVKTARDGLIARQTEQGYWCFPFEADCTIPAEYILMMHYVDEIDPAVEQKLCVYLRNKQDETGGWPLYTGGDPDVSCSVKSYYALKLAGDDPAAPHMRRARDAILARGGAVNANVFTHITLALFGQVPWRAVPFMPIEFVLLPRWFPIHMDKMSYWARTVTIPLMILCTCQAQARNPCAVGVRELFTVAPERERNYIKARSWQNRVFIGLDRVGRMLEPLIPKRLRQHAFDTALAWVIGRRNGDGGLGAIFPAMVNAYEVFDLLGYEADHPYRRDAKKALDDLLIALDDDSLYCQPCVSPVWDTCLGSLALEAVGDDDSMAAARRGLDWLRERQLLEPPGDWQRNHPNIAGGGWPFQFRNDAYPDVDDTAATAWGMAQAGDERYQDSIRRAHDWLCAMQSRNGGFAAFDADNEYYYLNEIPFADHGALLDPPTCDVSARVAALLGQLGANGDPATLDRVWTFLRDRQETWGGWHGRWGTNYLYGTWSVLAAAEQCGFDPASDWIQRAVEWVKSRQNADGGWGESNYSYYPDGVPGEGPSAPCQTAWPIMALLCAGETDAPEVDKGVRYLLDNQQADGLWDSPYFNAPGFPRVFYLKYHGYNAYFPLWALARFRRQRA